jgi:hypothetical protein
MRGNRTRVLFIEHFPKRSDIGEKLGPPDVVI